MLESEVSKQEVKEFVVSRPCRRCECVSRFPQPVGITFICFANITLLHCLQQPTCLQPLYYFLRFFSDSIPKTVTQSPSSIDHHTTTSADGSLTIPLCMGWTVAFPANPLLGCGSTTSHPLGRALLFSWPLCPKRNRHFPPLPKAHIITRLERRK